MTDSERAQMDGLENANKNLLESNEWIREQWEKVKAEKEALKRVIKALADIL